MGRVNRYKKVKACDPTSKNFGKVKADTKHDEPPELFEQRSKKINRDRDGRWDDEHKREQMYQREALRELRQNQAKENLKEKKIESKREDESMQQFKSRIRQETKKTLAEEIQKMTSTAQKRKLRLKERSLKRKNKKGGKGEDKEVMEFFSAENGHIRPSDLGESRSSFASTEDISFGERAERPPDLNPFTAKFRTTKSQQAQAESAKNIGFAEDNDSEGSAESEPESEQEEEVQLTKNQRNKKRKLLAQQRTEMDGDDGLESIRTSSEAMFKKPLNVGKLDKTQGSAGKNAAPALKKEIKPANKVGSKAYNELEALRSKVQDAYKVLKEKRRLENEALYKGTR